jgi:hypothetical protein
MLLAWQCPAARPRGYTDFDRVGFSSAAPRLARPTSESGGNRGLISMISQDTQLRGHERAAQEHDRSADVYEEHAVLLDRFGAHRSARTERRHAEEERDAAEAARTP